MHLITRQQLPDVAMLSFFVTFAALITNPVPKEVKFRALNFDQPEIELGVQSPKGEIEAFKVYAHALSSEKITATLEGRITLFTAEKNAAGKINWNPFVEANIPATLSSVIIIITRDKRIPRTTVISDSPEYAQGGSLRFFNTCPYAVGISTPGLKKILAAGKEIFHHPNLGHEIYGQAQFFTANRNGDWRAAGGIRWLQLNDIRTFWFISPDPQNSNLVTIHSIEERLPNAFKNNASQVNPKNAVSQVNN